MQWKLLCTALPHVGHIGGGQPGHVCNVIVTQYAILGRQSSTRGNQGSRSQYFRSWLRIVLSGDHNKSITGCSDAGLDKPWINKATLIIIRCERLPLANGEGQHCVEYQNQICMQGSVLHGTSHISYVIFNVPAGQATSRISVNINILQRESFTLLLVDVFRILFISIFKYC